METNTNSPPQRPPKPEESAKTNAESKLNFYSLKTSYAQQIYTSKQIDIEPEFDTSSYESTYNDYCEKVNNFIIHNNHINKNNADNEANAYNNYNKMAALYDVILKIKQHYKNKFEDCLVDICFEPPFENCSLVGFEKQSFSFSYKAYNVSKDKIYVDTTVRTEVWSDGYVNVSEHDNYDTVYNLYKTTKNAHYTCYVRVRKPAEGKDKELANKATHIIDSAIGKSHTITNGFKLFNLFSFIGKTSLSAIFCLLAFLTIGNNFITGTLLNQGAISGINQTFAVIFIYPVKIFEIIILSLLGIYLTCQIVCICNIRSYNTCILTKNFYNIKNIPTQILYLISVVLFIILMLFANAFSVAYCSAGLTSANINSIFGNVGAIKDFSSISQMQSVQNFDFFAIFKSNTTSPFETTSQAITFILGTTFSLCHLILVIYCIVRTIFVIKSIKNDRQESQEMTANIINYSNYNSNQIKNYTAELKQYHQNIVEN